MPKHNQEKMKKTLNNFRIIFLIVFIGVTACNSNDKPVKVKKINEQGEQYLVQDSLLIKTPDGAQIAAIVVRNAKITKPNTSILIHTIYARPKKDLEKAKTAAKKGYIGIVSYSRGKAWSPDKMVHREFEPNDTYAVIDWISKQPWSNGQVGMYGGSYNGFTQWAATKKMHPALKTIVPSVSSAPGIAEPMENGVYMNFQYSWFHYVINNKYLDTTLYNQYQRWGNLNNSWYEKGTSYRSLDSLDGLPNPEFQNKLNHPTYDTYWQKMIPYKEEFSKINIPILSTTGYYDGGQIGAMYYLKQHYKYNKNAEHYLVIGPYGHFGAQKVPEHNFNGYEIDKVAQISITDLIWDWFDYIFKGAKKPAILKDKINFQVMGANQWKHAASLKEVANDTLKFYLSNKLSNIKTTKVYTPGNNGNDFHYTLASETPKENGFISQSVDFKDRTMEGQNNYYAPSIINDSLSIGNGFSFVTDVFTKDFELNGSYLGELSVSINKKDMDYSLVLYEETSEGQYFKLTLQYIGRSSLAKNREKRELLTPNKITKIPFKHVRMTSKKIKKGSRLIVVLNINKHPFEQLNYGTGKDVSNETIKDAKIPLKVKWFNNSYIKIPIN